DFISDFKSNSESGDGYADLIFKNKDGDTAVILELKISKSDDDFEQDTNEALLQIEKKKYYEPFVKKVNIETIYCYGISFYNKQCYIAGKKIK
ncbi:MAG: PD-(D/E)XK nuclease domain-containing protein, partial [Succinivibrio sp.]|nr:PD-(D/E)XK nuclease domain-containing protein [Succinivibrio sp.]